MDTVIVEALRKQYGQLFPLIFHRSVERARSPGDLFDLLDTCPKDMPIIWDEGSRRWVNTEDLFQVQPFNEQITSLDSTANSP